MKKCSICGFQNNETSKFCENCGTKFGENTVDNKAQSLNTNTPVSNEEKNTIALVGFIVSLVSTLLCCGSFSVISLVLSIIGLTESKKVNGKNKGLAIAGIIISSVGIILLIIFSILGVLADAIATISG